MKPYIQYLGLTIIENGFKSTIKDFILLSIYIMLLYNIGTVWRIYKSHLNWND